MSILQEYESIRRGLGEVKFAGIELYLLTHPDIFLSDVYYKQDVYNDFEKWQQTMTESLPYKDAIHQLRARINSGLSKKDGSEMLDYLALEALLRRVEKPKPTNVDTFEQMLKDGL